MRELKDFNGKTAVVTGAANGIGREMAGAFARRGAKLVLADIDANGMLAVKEELEARSCEVHVNVVDVSSAAEVESFCDGVYREMSRVDVLCNNAGVALAGDFEDMSLEDLSWVVETNLSGVIYGCHYFYPRMIAQGGGGHIVNTASVGGLAPFMALAIYCCTKFGVVGLSETLRAEAAPHGIGVSVICPGVIATDIVQRSRIRSSTTGSSPERLGELMDRIIKLRRYSPDRVAEAAVRAVERNRGVVRVTPEAYMMDWAHRLSRRAFAFSMAAAASLARRVL